MKKIIIITGPGGAGKTTIAEMIAEKYNYALLDGDNEDTEFFPNGNQWLPENIDNLKKAHDKILKKTKKLVDSGKKVVVDYIIFGNYLNFFNKLKNEFGNDLQIIVLFPKPEDIIIRDKGRECWTTGEDRIKAVYSEFDKIKVRLGRDKYIDTTGLSVEETLDKVSNIL